MSSEPFKTALQEDRTIPAYSECFSLNLRVSFYNQVTRKAASTGLHSQPCRPASLPPREGGPAWEGQWGSRTGDLATTPIGPFPWEVQQRQVTVTVPSAWPLRSLGGGQAPAWSSGASPGWLLPVQFQRRGHLFRQALLVHTGPSRPPPRPLLHLGLPGPCPPVTTDLNAPTLPLSRCSPCPCESQHRPTRWGYMHEQ